MARKYSSPIKTVVLGAGVMGSQIAGLLVDAGLQVTLLDLAAEGSDPNSGLRQAIARLKKLKPAPLMLPELADAIVIGNYEQDLEKLQDADLVIEAIAERMDLKEQLYKKIAPHLNEHAVLVSNTSGLSINDLAESLPAKLRERFCGVHFFNPPRYMKLVEIIPSQYTDPALLDSLESFLVMQLGKGAVRAKDEPNFIANRFGVMSMCHILCLAQELNLGFDAIDAVTGVLIGHPKSATGRTIDVVGIDVLLHVIHTMHEGLKDDPWAALFEAPKWLKDLVAQGALGQKTGAGIYRKQGKDILVFDVPTNTYRKADTTVDGEVLDILKIKNPAEKMEKLRQCQKPQALLLWNIFRELFHYCAFHATTVAETTRDIDLAMRWGFGWSEGPFESWQACGWKKMIDWIEADIKSGKSFTQAPLPAWVKKVDYVYDEAGAYNFHTGKQQKPSALPVYQRQLFPTQLAGQKNKFGETIMENEGLRLWHMNDGIAIATFKTKNNIITDAVISGLIDSVAIAEADFKGLVLWQGDTENFCYGADLKNFSLKFMGDPAGLRSLVASFQGMVLKLRYSRVPVVAAVRGMVLGGGVEICLHAARVVAAAETYMGLVEAGVGILPAGGGSKEMALRAAQYAEGRDPFNKVKQFFEQLAMAKVTSSALEAKKFHYLQPTDVILMNSNEILYGAKACVEQMNAAGYLPPIPPRIPVVGRPGLATLQAVLENMRAGHFISDYDDEIATAIATILCGGNVDANTVVDETWLLNLELDHFVKLAQQEKTLQRIQHTLTTGKPLRN